MSGFWTENPFGARSEELIFLLHNRGLFTLLHIFKEDASPNWYTTQDMGLSGKLDEEWNCFIQGINQNVIVLSKNPDILVWSWNKSEGVVKVKEAYDALIFQSMDDDL